MSASQWVQFIIDLLSLGSLYALMALGLVIVYGILRLVNFAYGELVMVAGYTLLSAEWQSPALAGHGGPGDPGRGGDQPSDRVGGVPADPGPVPDRHARHLLRGEYPAAERRAVVRIAPGAPGSHAGAVLREHPHRWRGDAGPQSDRHRGERAPAPAVLTLLLKRTTLGIALRAAATRFAMTRMLGVPANLIVSVAFAISGVLAGVVALFWLGRIGSVTPTIGLEPLLVAFIATVIGGMRSLTGAVIGGYGLAVIDVSLNQFLPPALLAFRDAFTFSLVILILLVRPEGLIRGSATGLRAG